MDSNNQYTKIEYAKRLLRENYGMDDARAKRYILKVSINACVDETEAAKMITEWITCENPRELDL